MQSVHAHGFVAVHARLSKHTDFVSLVSKNNNKLTAFAAMMWNSSCLVRDSNNTHSMINGTLENREYLRC